MFVDIECWSYLRELKGSKRLDYSTQVFSVRTKEEFLTYLDGIKNDASPNHLRLVQELYGRT